MPNVKISDVKLRLATKADFDQIAEVQQNDGFSHSYFLTEGRFRHLISTRENFIVAEIGSIICAFASIQLDPGIRCRLRFLSVHQDHQNKAYAHRLLERAEEIAKSRGCGVIYTFVEEGAGLESYLVRKGFIHVGSYKNRYGNGRNATILERVL